MSCADFKQWQVQECAPQNNCKKGYDQNVMAGVLGAAA